MYKQNPELVEKIRQQFKTAPYPRIDLETTPKNYWEALYLHSIVTPYYLRNQKVISTEEKVILDAGCGTGYKSLILALANPGAKIVGIDLSEEAIDLARKRLEYHEIDQSAFHVLSIEEVGQLGQEFDYINVDDVLYLFEDITVGLNALKSVLKPQGIIRANLHSELQRTSYFRVQKVFKIMGLMDEVPGELEIEIARDTMRNLKDDVVLKTKTWSLDLEQDDERVLMNYLFVGDKGYTIPELFAALRKTNLQFISMLNWRHWELTDLFKKPDDLPTFLALSLPETSPEEQLHLFELLHPIHRLLDFWCGHTDNGELFTPIAQWTESDWQQAQVHLHPQLRTPEVKAHLLESISSHQSFEISRYVPLPTTVPIFLESHLAACLLPLWDGVQSLSSLVQLWQKLRPLDPITLESVSDEMAASDIKTLLMRLESLLYVLLERSV